MDTFFSERPSQGHFCWPSCQLLTLCTMSHCLKITQNVAFFIFQFLQFSPIFVYLKLTCLVTLFDRKLKGFKNSPKLTIFGIFNELLAILNVNVARFARNVECDFFCDFHAL